MFFYIYLKRDTAVYIAKNAYFDTIKGMKMKRVLPVNLELLNLAANIYRVVYEFRKKPENIHLWLNPKK